MTKTRTGDPFMSADEYGCALPRFSVSLLVRDVTKSLSFYRDVLGASVRYADNDFAALSLLGTDFMLHADHAYDHHPLFTRLQATQERGVGAELRFLGILSRLQNGGVTSFARSSTLSGSIMPTGGVKLLCSTQMDTSGRWGCPLLVQADPVGIVGLSWHDHLF
jgi:hypothetical protein